MAGSVCLCRPAASGLRIGAVSGQAEVKPVEAQGELALTGRVVDAAHILDARQIESLTHYLASFEARSRHQMVVVTVPSLGGRDIADYTRDLANRWGIGRKGANDGIVVLVAPHDRGVRIAVGYGLEKILTHAYCQHVIDAVMIPQFRDGHYYDGADPRRDRPCARGAAGLRIRFADVTPAEAGAHLAMSHGPRPSPGVTAMC
ncbi:MAG: TPM domain-containing protein [Sphingomonas sp.]